MSSEGKHVWRSYLNAYGAYSRPVLNATYRAEEHSGLETDPVRDASGKKAFKRHDAREGHGVESHDPAAFFPVDFHCILGPECYLPVSSLFR